MTIDPKTGTATQVERSHIGNCEDAVHALEQVLHILPHQRYREIDVAERAIVRLRDGLIEELRQNPAGERAERMRNVLKQVNVAISLVAGIEYPAAGPQGQLLEQARIVLQNLLDAELC
jgi:hypothetical protein